MFGGIRFGREVRVVYTAACYAFLLILGNAKSATTVHATDAFTSAPIDYSLYREGEVQRIQQHFTAWQLTCDEIRRLSRRFCSLRGVVRASDGTIIAALLVSTDEAGRPAAILRLPLGMALPNGLTLQQSSTLLKRKSPIRILRPSFCDQNGCEVIWAITAEDIRRLKNDEVLFLTFQIAGPPPVFGALLSRSVPIEGVIQTTGFAAALKASMTQ